jgi:hypothetical protein
MQLKRGSATVSVALAGVSPASLTIIPPTPIGEEAGAARVFGETPKTAVETTALPNPTASFRLRSRAKTSSDNLARVQHDRSSAWEPHL